MKWRSIVLPRLEEPGRERPVVPGGVEPGHPGGEAVLDAGGEVRGLRSALRQGENRRGTRGILGRVLSRDEEGVCGRSTVVLDPFLTPRHPPENPNSPAPIATTRADTARAGRRRRFRGAPRPRSGEPLRGRGRQDCRGARAGRGRIAAQGRGAEPGEADQAEELGDAQQVATGAEHLAAAEQPDDLLELGDPQQLRDRRGRRPRRAPRPVPSETIWPTRPRPRALSSTSQTTQLTAASAAEAIVIRGSSVENRRPSSRPPNSRRRITAWATTAALVPIPVPATIPPTPNGL